MAKEIIKKKAKKKQKNVCALTGKVLPEETRYFDTNRPLPKAQGGIYTEENTTAVDPVAHMAYHNNLRERTKAHEALKAIVDDREQKRKAYYKINNQMLAYKRKVDYLHPLTLAWLSQVSKKMAVEVKAVDKQMAKAVADFAAVDPFMASAMGVKGIGPVTLAYCAVYIDLNKAQYPSSLWSYVGLHKASHERYVKGKPSGGNKSLRTALWTMADSQMKSGGAYRPVYDATKKRLENSNKITISRVFVKNKGQETGAYKLMETPWKDTKPGHRHGAALRAMMKHFLADYWLVGRTFLGLPTPHLYAEEKLGHTQIISPAERGWVY